MTQNILVSILGMRIVAADLGRKLGIKAVRSGGMEFWERFENPTTINIYIYLMRNRVNKFDLFVTLPAIYC